MEPREVKDRILENISLSVKKGSVAAQMVKIIVNT